MYMRRCSLLAWIAYCVLDIRHGKGMSIEYWPRWHRELYYALGKLDSKALNTIYETG